MTAFFRTLNSAAAGPNSDLTSILRGLVEGMGWAGYAVWQYAPGSRGLEEVASWSSRPASLDGGLPNRAWNDGAVTGGPGQAAVSVRMAGRPMAVLGFATGDGHVVDDELRAELEEAGTGAFAHLYSMYRHTLAPAVLTAREQEVLQWSAQGHGTAQIATGLNVAHSTVKTHFENLYVKLGVTDRAAAVAQGFRRGLLV